MEKRVVVQEGVSEIAVSIWVLGKEIPLWPKVGTVAVGTDFVVATAVPRHGGIGLEEVKRVLEVMFGGFSRWETEVDTSLRRIEIYGRIEMLRSVGKRREG